MDLIIVQMFLLIFFPPRVDLHHTTSDGTENQHGEEDEPTTVKRETQ